MNNRYKVAIRIGQIGASFLLVVSQGANIVRAEDHAGAGDPARGKQLFYQHGCYGCHGYSGETGFRNLVGTGSPIVENADLFVTFLRLRADVMPGFPSTTMPNYAATSLSDAAARDIFAYVSSFKLDSPRADDVPALRAIMESARRGTADKNTPAKLR
jgi:mono/diheme cytochrome c family protein